VATKLRAASCRVPTDSEKERLDYYNISYQQRGKIGGMQSGTIGPVPRAKQWMSIERFNLGDQRRSVTANPVIHRPEMPS